MKKIALITGLFFILLQVITARDFDKAKMDSLFAIIENNDKGMGSISVFWAGEEMYQRSYGYADVENKLKADEDTKYRIGSISKTFTAAIIMKLIEENKLSLTSSLKDFYPQIKNADKITIEQMLQHRSGITNFSSIDYTQWHTHKHTKEQLINRIVSGGVTFEAGEKMEYSNSNYVLLTFIAEDVSGKSFSDLLHEMIIVPCNLKNTYMGTKTAPKDNEAYSYARLSDWERVPETDMSIFLGAGSIVSTPYDLNVFFDHLFTGKILSAESLEKMKNLKDNFGLGLFRVPFYHITGYGHNGGIDGFQSNAFYFPESKLAVALIENGVVYPLNDIIIGVLSIYFGMDYKLPIFVKSLVLKTEDLDKYLGVYSTPSLPLKLTITKKDNTLIFQGTGQPAFPLECFAENIFRYDPARLELVFFPDENKVMLKQNGMTFNLIKN